MPRGNYHGWHGQDKGLGEGRQGLESWDVSPGGMRRDVMSSYKGQKK